MLRSAPNYKYSRSSCCWNCKSPGHRATECYKKRQLFCSYCLKDGTTSRDCDCRSATRTTPTYRFPPLADNDIRKYTECSGPDVAREMPIRITVGDECFRTYIDTSRLYSSVGWLVSTKASIFHGVRREFKRTEEGIISEVVIPLRIAETTRAIRCKVAENEPEVITLGCDALKCFGFQLTLANCQCLDIPGCPAYRHESVYGLPIEVGVEETRPLPKAPRGPKNPIDLSLGNTEELSEVKPTPDISEIINTPLVPPEFDPQNRWEDLILAEAQDDISAAATTHIMSLPDTEIEEYLRLDADLMDVEKLQ